MNSARSGLKQALKVKEKHKELKRKHANQRNQSTKVSSVKQNQVQKAPEPKRSQTGERFVKLTSPGPSAAWKQTENITTYIKFNQNERSH